MPLNDSTATSIANASKACGFDEFTDKYLTFPPSGQQPDVCDQPGINSACTNYLDGCDVFDTAFSALFDLNPGFNICKWSPLQIHSRDFEQSISQLLKLSRLDEGQLS